jgi:cell division protein FtsI/penicillin-binding protein 2
MDNQAHTLRSIRRVHIWYAFIAFIFAACLIRLFYLQIIRHNYYQVAAQSDQYKEYQIPASRGIIKAYDGDKVVPIVLSHELFTLYADPSLIKNPDKVASDIQKTIGGDRSSYADLMKKKGRYVVLAKKITKEQKESILKHKYPGLGAQGLDYRTYPQGVLASQLLGFVDDSGAGRYGLEEALNKELTGKPGELKAVTDINGVPLAASEDNVRIQPTPGKDVVLTVDIGMQKQAEQLLKQGLESAKSGSGSVVILEAKSGAVKAMANYPTYDPANYAKVEDASVFNNAAATEAIEVGSTMKPLTAAAALNLGVVKPGTTYYDPSKIKVDDAVVSNIEEDGGPGTKSIADILNLSLNTGATWLLMQMGHGELNKQARQAWYDYMTTHYRFGERTGIEQGYESPGTVPSPTKGYGLNITYANTAFGQAMTATSLQMAGAYMAMLNGGTYYQPHLVAATIDAAGNEHKTTPKILANKVVSPAVSKDLQSMMEYVVNKHHFSRGFDNNTYSVGGKTGTAQIAKDGVYLDDVFNGTYCGFVGGDDPEYIISVRVDRPQIAGYAGSQAAQPIFGNVAHMLIDNFNVSTKTQ